MEWISVFDCLPDIGSRVLIYAPEKVMVGDPSNHTPILITSRISHECNDGDECCGEVDWWENPYGGNSCIGGVTHWCALPNIPK